MPTKTNKKTRTRKFKSVYAYTDTATKKFVTAKAKSYGSESAYINMLIAKARGVKTNTSSKAKR